MPNNSARYVFHKDKSSKKATGSSYDPRASIASVSMSQRPVVTVAGRDHSQLRLVIFSSYTMHNTFQYFHSQLAGKKLPVHHQLDFSMFLTPVCTAFSNKVLQNSKFWGVNSSIDRDCDVQECMRCYTPTLPSHFHPSLALPVPLFPFNHLYHCVLASFP